MKLPEAVEKEARALGKIFNGLGAAAAMAEHLLEKVCQGCGTPYRCHKDDSDPTCKFGLSMEDRLRGDRYWITRAEYLHRKEKERE